jgi:adenosylcobinamide-GDP ribazoletransferase
MVVSGAAVIGVVVAFRQVGAVGVITGSATLCVLRAALLRRLGGFTGDCAGAAVELIETMVATAVVLYECH